MGVLADINKKMFGGNEMKSKSLLNEQQQQTMNQIEGSAQTYRDMAQGSQSMYNQDWENIQNQQVMQPLQQRMGDNIRELKNNNKKFGRATSAIANRLNESASLRMNEMKMQQGVIGNQRRAAMQEKARDITLGYESMANQQDATVLGRQAKENFVEQTGGLMTPILQSAQMATTAKNLAKQFSGLGGSPPKLADDFTDSSGSRWETPGGGAI